MNLRSPFARDTLDGAVIVSADLPEPEPIARRIPGPTSGGGLSPRDRRAVEAGAAAGFKAGLEAATPSWPEHVARMSADERTELRRTCRHEAAHAVLAYLLDAGVEYVEVVGREGGDRPCAGSTRVRRFVPLHQVVEAAGYAADVRSGVPPSEAGAGDDLERIRAPISSKIRRLGVREACRRARALLDAPGAWNAVLDVAEALERCGRLEGGTVAAFVNNQTGGLQIPAEAQCG